MILIKVGGGKDINMEYVAQDVASLVQAGEQVVLVHGANAVRDELAVNLNAPTRTIVSPSGVESVYTDQKAMDVFLMSYAGLVNKKIVASLIGRGVRAIGLSGVDGALFEATKKRAVYKVENGKTKLITNNLTGTITKVNIDLINLLLGSGYVLVCTAPAVSLEGEILNVDNDKAVAVLARELKPEKVVSLFEAPGMLEDYKDESSLIKEIKKGSLAQYLDLAKGRMKKKILSAEEILDSGVEAIYWGDGRVENPVRKALAGNGTILQY